MCNSCMNKSEFRQQVALQAVQGFLEAKLGYIGEIDPKILAKEVIRIADAVTDTYFEKISRIMTKEEAIKEAYGIPVNKKQHEALQILIPELAESEDERIRKAILSGLKYLETELGWDVVGDVDILDAYTWLENQKAAETPQWMIDFLKEIQPYCINKEEYAGYAGRIEFESKILTIIKWLEGNFIRQKECDEETGKYAKEHPANLEEAAEEYAPDFSDSIDSKEAVDAMRNAFKAGAEWAEDHKPEIKLTGWVARDRNGEIYVYGAYPEKDSEKGIWIESNSILLYRRSFLDLKWEDEPIEVEVTIKKK